VRTGMDTDTYACAHVHDVTMRLMFFQNNNRSRVKVRRIQGQVPTIIFKLCRKFHCVFRLKNTVISVFYLIRTLHLQENTEVSAAMISIQQRIYGVSYVYWTVHHLDS